MATVTLNATEVKEYRDDVLQSGEYIYMGSRYISSSSTYYHDVVIVLDLPRSLINLTVKHEWYVQVGGGTAYNYGAALTQEERTSAPDTAELTYKIPSKEATITFEKELKKGRWYLWLWRHSKSAPSYMRGIPGTHPILTITGETAGGTVTAFVSGEAKAATPKVWRGGEWQDPLPKVYRGGQWVDPI